MKRLLILLLTCMMSYAFAAAPTPTPSAVNQLTGLLGNYTTYAANFKQLTLDDQKEFQSKGTGRIYIERPGKFRWDQLAPMQQETILNGNVLTNYDVSLMQATKRTIKNMNEEQNPAALLTNRVSNVIKYYNVVRVILQKKLWYELTPKSKTAGFQRVYFHFQSGHLESLIVINNLGDRSLYTFTQIKVNQHIPDSYFEFDPPRGVDVNVQN